MSVHRQIALLLSILNTLLAVSHIYAMWKLLSANSYRRRQEMLVDIVTDSSNKINGIMKLLKTKKRLRCNRRFWERPDEPVRGGTILSMTLLYPRSGVKTFVCLRSPL